MVLAALLVPAAAQASSRGPCVPHTKRPRCTIWKGTAPYGTDDGDTLDVHVDGTPKRSFSHVRITGIQAMEMTAYAPQRVGECHAVQAADRVEQLLAAGHKKVRLSAQDPASVSRRRPLRSVAVRLGGRWVDIGQTLVGEGLALWLPNRTENAFNQTYSSASQQAQALAARGLWDADACGVGPSEGAPLKVWVSSNPDGADAYALDEEYIAVRNLDPVNAIDLSLWWVRDSALHRYTFPAGTVLGPGQTVTVHVGTGTDTATDRYFNLRAPIFGNASDATNAGDGGYLFDPQGDLRAAMIYPCRTVCSDPNGGLVRLEPHERGTESVTLVNTATVGVDLQGYRLFSRPYGYAFGPDSVLAPGESLRVTIKGDPDDDTHALRHWAQTGNILSNHGDKVTLKTFDDVVIACAAWGSRTCA